MLSPVLDSAAVVSSFLVSSFFVSSFLVSSFLVSAKELLSFTSFLVSAGFVVASVVTSAFVAAVVSEPLVFQHAEIAAIVNTATPVSTSFFVVNLIIISSLRLHRYYGCMASGCPMSLKSELSVAPKLNKINGKFVIYFLKKIKLY